MLQGIWLVEAGLNSRSVLCEGDIVVLVIVRETVMVFF